MVIGAGARMSGSLAQRYAIARITSARIVFMGEAELDFVSGQRRYYTVKRK